MSKQKLTLSEKIKKTLKDYGPAFFIIGYVVGTGSVTSMVVSGAKFGLSLSWALLLSCFFTYFLLISISKLTIISGKTLMLNFKQIFGKPITQPAHKSDVIRLQVLIQEGGIYADTDVIFVKPFTDLLNNDFVMGQQGVNGSEGLCPATMLGIKDSKFAKQWLAGFKDTFGGGPPGSDTWCTHSVSYPQWLAQQMQYGITIIDHDAFFLPLYHQNHIEMLFEQDISFPNAYSHHLWESSGKKYLEEMTIEKIKNENTTFTRLVKDLI